MVSQYRENRSGLQAQMEAGITFKKSISKSVAELEFVPVNLHVQEMKVAIEGSDDKGEGERERGKGRGREGERERKGRGEEGRVRGRGRGREGEEGRGRGRGKERKGRVHCS